MVRSPRRRRISVYFRPICHPISFLRKLVATSSVEFMRHSSVQIRGGAPDYQNYLCSCNNVLPSQNRQMSLLSWTGMLVRSTASVKQLCPTTNISRTGFGYGCQNDFILASSLIAALSREGSLCPFGVMVLSEVARVARLIMASGADCLQMFSSGSQH